MRSLSDDQARSPRAPPHLGLTMQRCGARRNSRRLRKQGMDLELFARQIHDEQQRVYDLFQRPVAPSDDLSTFLDRMFAELNTMLDELRAAEEELRRQYAELLDSQQALDRERRRYQDLFHFAPDAYLVTNERGVIQEANQALGLLLNSMPQLLLDKPLHLFVARSQLAMFSERLRRLRAAPLEGPDEWEMSIQPFHDAPRDVWVRIAPIFDLHGRLIGLRWLIRDLTERKRAEAERAELLAREQERQRLHELFQQAPALIAVTYGPTHIFEFANPGYLRVASYSLEQLIGRSVREIGARGAILPPERFDQVGQTGQAAVIDEVALPDVAGDRGMIWLHVTLQPLHSADGAVERILLHAVDVTERKQAEMQLQTSEATLRAIFDGANQSIVLIDPAYAVLAFNQLAAAAAEAIDGRPLYVGQSILEYVAPERRAEFRGMLQQSLDGAAHTFEQQIAGRAGNVWWELSFNPIQLPDGETRGVMLIGSDITDRKRAEQDLHESEERLRLALEAGRMGYWDWLIDQRLILWSPAHNQMLGLPPDQREGTYEQFIARVHPADVEMVEQSLQRALAGNRSYQAEYRVIWPDGTLRWVAGEGRPYSDAPGPATRMIGVVRDITRQRQAQQALRVAEERLRTVVTHVPVVLWAIDQQGVFTLAEGNSLALLGVQPGQVVGRSIFEVFEDEPEMLACVREALSGQRERWVMCVRGVSFEAQSTLLRDERDQIVGLIGVSWDITEQQRAHERLRLLSEASAALGASIDYETTLTQLAELILPALANACTIALLGPDQTLRRLTLARSQAVPAAVQIPGAPARPDDPHPVWRALRSGESILLDAPPEAPASAACTLIVPLVARQQPLGVLSASLIDRGRSFTPQDVQLIEEIARRAALAVDHARLYRDTQVALQARDTFLSIASHELKTPLTSILGYTYVLRQTSDSAGPVEERTQRAVAVIERQAQRLNALIDNMLDLSRIQRGQLSIERRPVDLRALVTRAVEEQRQSLTDHVMTLNSLDEPLIVHGDELRLEQVVTNLLSNAVKYSPQGGPIRVRLSAVDRAAQLSVSDPGIGIPAAALPRLFEPFFRADNVSAQSSGFGIGLFLVRTILQLHGGAITVESVQGRGSTFMVTLPLAER
jgi:PAS domain S-box-containing protein